MVFSAQAQTDLYSFLKKIPGAEITPETSTVYKEYYVVMFPQPLDHQHPDKTFKQRIFIGLQNPSAITVMETDGYAGDRAENADFQDEPEKLFNANQIFVEHRFFAKSVPDTIDYSCLTMHQAVDDYHSICMALKSFFTGQWVSTGISKGGQMATAWKMWYPADVTATIAYVAPMNLALEDQRIYDHFNTVGTQKTRDKIDAFQLQLLKNKATYLPWFKNVCEKYGYQFSPFDVETVFDWCVLEYEFSFWQWHANPKEIPSAKAKPAKLLIELLNVIPPDYFTMPGMADYFTAMYQNYTQLGYYEYNYEIPQFKPYLKNSSYPNSGLAPQGVTLTWDQSYMDAIKNFMDSKPSNMIFVYGQMDPWGSTSFDNTNNPGVLKFFVKGGTHASRIANLSSSQKAAVYKALDGWLGTNL